MARPRRVVTGMSRQFMVVVLDGKTREPTSIRNFTLWIPSDEELTDESRDEMIRDSGGLRYGELYRVVEVIAAEVET